MSHKNNPSVSCDGFLLRLIFPLYSSFLSLHWIVSTLSIENRQRIVKKTELYKTNVKRNPIYDKRIYCLMYIRYLCMPNADTGENLFVFITYVCIYKCANVSASPVSYSSYWCRIFRIERDQFFSSSYSVILVFLSVLSFGVIFTTQKLVTLGPANTYSELCVCLRWSFCSIQFHDEK